MTITPVPIWGPIQLGTSAALLGTVVPPNGKQTIKRAVFTNVSGAPVTITVFVDRQSAGTTNANTVIDAFTLSAGQAYVAAELANCVLNGGDAVWALASLGSVVTTMASGWQQ